MLSALYYFVGLQNLEPLDLFLLSLPIGGKSLYEEAIFAAQELGCQKIYFLGVSKENLPVFSHPERIYASIIHLASVDELKDLPTCDYLILRGGTIFSAKAKSNISNQIINNKTSGLIWYFSALPYTYYARPCYLSSQNNPSSLLIRQSPLIEAVHGELFAGLLFIPESLSASLLVQLVKFFMHDDRQIMQFQLSEFFIAHQIEKTLLEHITLPWQALNAHELLMAELVTKIDGKIEDGVTFHGPVVVETNAEVLRGVYIKGPVYIATGATVGPNCFLRPNSYIGSNAYIGQSVELKNTIIMHHTHVGHLSYIGDSIIGPENNYGAGSKTANLAFHNKEIKMRINGERISTGRRKMGIITGEKVKTGINASLMPGIKLYNKSIVGAHVLIQRDLPSQMIYAYDEENNLVQKQHRFY
jgi:acetyltransferase-like isoleucine patch superfamily enzyme